MVALNVASSRGQKSVYYESGSSTNGKFSVLTRYTYEQSWLRSMPLSIHVIHMPAVSTCIDLVIANSTSNPAVLEWIMTFHGPRMRTMVFLIPSSHITCATVIAREKKRGGVSV